MAALCIPKGKGDGEVEPPLGGTGAATDDGTSADDAEARDDEAVAPLAAMLSCDMPRVLIANGGPSACCAGLVKSE